MAQCDIEVECPLTESVGQCSIVGVEEMVVKLEAHSED